MGRCFLDASQPMRRDGAMESGRGREHAPARGNRGL